MHQFFNRPADDRLGTRCAEKSYAGGIDKDDPLVDQHKQSIWGELDQAAVSFLAGEQSLLRLSPLESKLRLAQRSMYSRRKGAQPMFEHEIGRTALQGLNGHF